MNGIHDVGGMNNLGELVRDPEPEIFHEDWERVMFANAIALLGGRYFKVDEVRRATEWMPPADYLQSPYYGTWLYAITALLIEKGLVTEDELAKGHSSGGTLQALPKEIAQYVMNNPIPANVDADIPARFKPGDIVHTKNINTIRHTRLPRYARGKEGAIVCDHGIFLLPDTNGHGGPDKPQHVYGVRFSARELWGDAETAAQDAVYIDLFDDYLEAKKT
jgi:nitrile hydratase subunit beta